MSGDSSGAHKVRAVFARVRLQIKKLIHGIPPTFLGATVVFLFLVAWVYNQVPSTGVSLFDTEYKHYSQAYSFVPETLSKSAPILVTLPEGVDPDLAQTAITFNPELVGTWVRGEEQRTLLFQPAEPLETDQYYEVALETAEAKISGDFKVVDDPTVEAIFPSSNSETTEYSEITIVFSRPMIPLTTLTELELMDLPVTISPATEGKFKWVSTRNLQFIPETRLQRSTTYTVSVGDGMRSVDGVPVTAFDHTFVTRPLRYESISTDAHGYNRPVVVNFNQPVKLEENRDNIVITKQDGTNVPFEITYGTRRVYDRDTRSQEEIEDISQLWLYPKEDSHGRERLWDFATNYTIQVSRAYPFEGDIQLNETKRGVIRVGNIISNITARSDRSDAVKPELFDPQGELVVRFVEGVDLSRSTIKAKGLLDIRYDQSCVRDDEGRIIYDAPDECREEDVLDTAVLTFTPEAFAKNEAVIVLFEKIVNTERLTINATPLQRTFTTYPELIVSKTTPSEGATSASVTEFEVCSNTPLKQRSAEEYQDYLSANNYLVFGSWRKSRFISINRPPTETCRGEFRTTIRYGLHPEEPYRLEANIEDEFGQAVTQTINFQTEKPKDDYVRFHNLQKQYNVTPSNRTKLTYAVENLEYVDLTICKLPPVPFLQMVIDSYSRTSAPPQDECLQVSQDRIELPKRYWTNNYFQVDLAQYFSNTRGQYLVSFSHPLMNTYDSRQRQTLPYYDHTFISVTDLAVAEKKINWNSYRDQELNQRKEQAELLLSDQYDLYWITRIGSLAAVPNAKVTTYSRAIPVRRSDSSPLIKAQESFSDLKGVARSKAVAGVEAAVIETEDDVAVVSEYADRLQYVRSAQGQEFTYIYTDRPIYRPGHEVFIKGIDRIGYDGAHLVVEGQKTDVVITDSKRQEIFKQEVEINQYGTFATQFRIPNDAPLGRYRISVLGRDHYFEVEEYVPAAFKLELTTDQEEYINGDTFELSVDAEYYFGVPLEEAEVTYSISAQDYFFDRYDEGGFSFGRGWYYCYSCGYNDQFLSRGSAKTNDDGKAIIEEQIDFNQLFEDADNERSKIFVVQATVQDKAGKSVSAQSSFIVHKGEVYVGAQADPAYTSVGTQSRFKAKTVTTEGVPKAHDNVEFLVEKIEWNTLKRREVDGGFYYQSEEVRDQVLRREIDTNRSGDVEITHTFTEPGRYELTVKTTDKRGNVVKATRNLYIYGSGSVSVRPSNDFSLELSADTQAVAIGDRPRIIVQSPYERAKALITVDRGRVLDYWVVDVTSNLFDYVVPIKEAYSPNMFVSVVLLSPDPEIKQGVLEFQVEPDLKQLLVNLFTNKDTYLPGEEVTLDISTTDNGGRPEQSELSVAVADMSVLALKGNPKKDPLRYFYPGFPLRVMTASNLKHILYEREIPVGTKGGGGGDPDDLEKRQRGVFKDTAFWQAQVVTDEAGKARLSFRLPDNLTTWRIEALAVTEDTKLGVAYKEIMARKRLMTIPLKPRFVIPGDELSVGATVFNQTNETQTFVVTMQSDTLEFLEETTKEIRLKPEENRIVYFDARAPVSLTEGAHGFTIGAVNADYEDVVEQSIKITPNNTYETVATAHFTKADQAQEFIYVPGNVVPGKGGLTISTNATMAVFATDALNYLIEYPYGCSEQMASKLSAIAVVKRGLAIENMDSAVELEQVEFEGALYSPDEVIEIGLSRIYENQKQNGGFAYYAHLEASPYLTLHLLQTLYQLQQAGYEVDETRMKRAATYVYQDMLREGSWRSRERKIITAYVLAETGLLESTQLVKLFGEIRSYIQDDKYLAEGISPITLTHLALLTREDYFRASEFDRVFTALENRIDIDGRGAFLSSRKGGERLWQYYETPVKNTGLLLKVLALQEREHPLTDKILRWLMKSRSKDGAWGSTNNTVTVVEAMTEYLLWQRETEAEFTLTTQLDDEEVAREEFSADSILSTRSTYLPIDTFLRDTMQTIRFDRERANELETNFYYDMALKYYLPAHQIPPRDEGITIERNLYSQSDTDYTTPVTTATVGEVLRGRMMITVPSDYTIVSVEDYIPAGFELVNFNLATEGLVPEEDELALRSAEEAGDARRHQPGLIANSLGSLTQSAASLFGMTTLPKEGIEAYDTRLARRPNTRAETLRPDFEELRDDRLFLFSERLSAGVYVYEYYVRATTPGRFQYLPAMASQMYYPEIFGRTEGKQFVVTKK